MEDMTTSPTPTFKLDPKALAAAVPLRRVGTQEVRIKSFGRNCIFLIYNVGHGRYYPFPSESGWCLC